MGCDIHLYAEHRQHDRWWSAGGRWNPGRDYLLFAHLAGVRGNADPVVDPRGFPDDAAWTAHGDYAYFVDAPGTERSDDDSPAAACDESRTPKETFRHRYAPVFDLLEENDADDFIPLLLRDVKRSCQSCELADAERWVRSGASRWLKGPHEPTDYGMVGIVSDPDAHSATWLTLAELKEAINRRERDSGWGRVNPQYHAVVGMLDAMESRGVQTRIVFWFDN